ncbi:MAG: serine/threonine-protein kinase [Polyangiales bacterium]
MRCIGRGGMGAVYEAEHADLEKRVALKTLHPHMAREAEARARFLREGRAASRIRHPNVVEVFDVGQHDDGTLYLVMEHLVGEDLSTLISREGPLDPERLVDLLLPVVAAVATAHEEKVVHRDLKPENIFLARTRNGAAQPKVLDFGISKVVDTRSDLRITGNRAMLGTPVYMSPEQARGEAVDARSDQYAMGVILYEATTGRLPFDADELIPLIHAIASGTHTPPRALRPDLPAEFEAVIERAMSRDASARYESMHALGRALLPFASRTNRALWREVFGANPTPLAQPAVELPPAPAVVSAPPTPTLVPRVREVCATVTLSERAKVPAAILGTLAAVLVAAALLVPSRRPPPHAATPAPTVVAPAPTPSPSPAPEPGAPVVAAPAPVVALPPSVAAPAPAPPAEPARRPRPRTVVRAARPAETAPRPTSTSSEPSFRLCGGVPCP